MKNYTHYLDYTVEQWVEDPDFLKWLKEPNSDYYSVFSRLKKMEPDVAQKMDEAQNLLFEMIAVEPSLSKDTVEKIWKGVQRETRKSKQISRTMQIWRVSVAATVLLVLGFTVLMHNVNSGVSYNDLSENISLDSIKNVTLKIGDNSEILLSNKAEVMITDDNRIIVRTAKGEEMSMSGVEFSDKKMGWLAVPKGKRASVSFADGSKATLRPGSKIVFPSEFGKINREIFVEGEVFMEVTKNKLKPFIVKTDKMDVEVLGTSFDVQAYPSQNTQSVILVTGLVNVKTTSNRVTQITPNQKFTLDASSNTEIVKQVKVYDYISWKEDILSFESEKLSVVLKALSNYYGITFNYNAEQLNQITLSGKLNLNDNIEDVMLVLTATANIKYETINTNIIKIDVKQ